MGERPNGSIRQGENDIMTEDKLDKIWKLQAEYNIMLLMKDERFNQRFKSESDKISALCRAIIHEAIELDRLTNWKWWKKPETFFHDKAKGELIDIQHFVVWAAQILGMTPEEFFEEYRKKNMINRQRQREGY